MNDFVVVTVRNRKGSRNYQEDLTISKVKHFRSKIRSRDSVRQSRTTTSKSRRSNNNQTEDTNNENVEEDVLNKTKKEPETLPKVSIEIIDNEKKSKQIDLSTAFNNGQGEININPSEIINKSANVDFISFENNTNDASVNNEDTFDEKGQQSARSFNFSKSVIKVKEAAAYSFSSSKSPGREVERKGFEQKSESRKASKRDKVMFLKA